VTLINTILNPFHSRKQITNFSMQNYFEVTKYAFQLTWWKFSGLLEIQGVNRPAPFYRTTGRFAILIVCKPADDTVDSVNLEITPAS
jgi:hypothetical protein